MILTIIIIAIKGYCKFLINTCFIIQAFIHKENLLENHTYSRLNENNITIFFFWVFLTVIVVSHNNIYS